MNIDGYYHVGDMRYLTSRKKGFFDKVQLTYQVSFFKRLRPFIKSKGASSFIKDHTITNYRKKLAIIAMRASRE